MIISSKNVPDPGFEIGIRKNFTLDPGVKKHRIPDPDPQHWCTLVVGEHVIVNLLIN
jgi:hypothetical protein